MTTLRMRRLVGRWSLSVFILFLIVKSLQFLRNLGFAAKENGWRKVTRVYLRTEHSKFILACFGLNFWKQDVSPAAGGFDTRRAQVVKQLEEFFRQQPAVQWKVEWGRFSARMAKKELIDITLADFDEDGSLRSLTVYFDSSAGSADFDAIDSGLRDDLIAGLIKIYNKTKDLDDKRRPWILSRELEQWLLTEFTPFADRSIYQARDYLERVLSSTFINFEETGQGDLGYGRFQAPSFIKRKHPGYGLLNIVCRLNNRNNYADLWFQCNHIPIDGLPMQEVLDELKARWGDGNRLRFPPVSRTGKPQPQLCSSKDGAGGIYNLNRIINFRPLIGLEKELCRQYAGQQRRAVTVLRLLIWKLGINPAFNGSKFLIPVAVPKRNGEEKTLGFVLIRPGIYFDTKKTEDGFPEFQQEFNRQVKAIIARKNESYELFESYALLPAFMYSVALKLFPRAMRELVGSVGITIINKADLFVAPFSDVHTGGFIAISNFFTPTEDGDIGCHVSIKGTKDRINGYLAAIEEIAAAKA